MVSSVGHYSTAHGHVSLVSHWGSQSKNDRTIHRFWVLPRIGKSWRDVILRQGKWPMVFRERCQCQVYSNVELQSSLNLILRSWRSKDQLFEKEVRRYQWKRSVKTTAKKICVIFLLFILYAVILWLVILARSQLLWIIFLTISALMGFIYFVFYRTEKFASNLR